MLLPGNMQGLTEEQISELKLRDEFEEVCVPSGGYIMNPDPMGRRNGRGTPSVLLLCVCIQHLMTRYPQENLDKTTV